MQTVFTNDMVAHVWAQQNQPSGRSGNGQFYFEGRAIYSYGRHFMTGYYVADGHVLLNADTYGITTTRHQSYTWRALSYGVKTYRVSKLQNFVYDCFEGGKVNEKALIDYYARIPESDWTQGLADFVEYVLKPKQAHDVQKAARKRFEKAAKEKAAKQLASDKKAAKDFIDRCKSANLLNARTASTTQITPLNSSWAQTFKLDSLADYDGLPKAVKVLNQWLVHCRKFGDAVMTKKYVWPLVKAMRERLAYAESRIKLDARLRTLKELKLRIRDALESYSRGDAVEFYHLCERHSLIGSNGLLGGFTRDLSKGSKWRPMYEAAKAMHAKGKVIYEAEQEALRLERVRKDHEAKAARFEAWKKGESVSSYQLPEHVKGYEFAYLRIRGDNVETSRGATVPLAHAVRLWRFMKAIKQPWEGDHNAPVRVGHFTLEYVKDNVAKIGCHKLHFDDMQALAETIGE